ncbi:MAG: cytochrome P450 [Thiotrichales bacterium]|nr:cytochrome P450 [Thiotrichales bacterium]|tara:strand:- start:74 stop:1339 length:1266 start_codon:yes stop_codon:yes gene_type:complete
MTEPGHCESLSTELDITSPELYLRGIPYEQFDALRATPGLVWHPYEDNGFWAVTRHADVKMVSKAPERFSSAIGHTNLWDLEADALEARRSLIDSDASQHRRLRRIVSRVFTPKKMLEWEQTTRDIAAELLDRYQAAGGGDWVDKVAAPLPIRVILAILGVPQQDGDYLVELSNYLVEGTGDRPSLPDDAFGNTTPLRLLPFASPAAHALFEYGAKIGEQRQHEPRDDVVTQLVYAEIEGERLTEAEYKNFFQLLVFAGNETTRTAITHGGIAFADFPGQWRRLVAEPSYMPTAIEELLRWTTPVMHMRRTAVDDTELAGTTISKGDKVVMWYASANRDDSVFEDPYRFDIGRIDNPHFAFGGGGPHFCLGAYLAKMEIRILLEEMMRRGMTLERDGEPVRAASNFVHGVLSVDLKLGARH